MKPKLALVLVVIVVVPLALLAWLGARTLSAERTLVRHQVLDLLTSRLRDTDRSIAQFMNERERQLLRLTDLPEINTEKLRDLGRVNPLVTHVFLLSPKGRVLHPPPGAETESERDFLHRAARFISDKTLVRGPAGPDHQGTSSPAPDKGWYAWYWENGLNLIFWRRSADGHVIGAELERARLTADLIARLPGNETPLPNGCIALADSNDAIVYRWGSHEPAEKEAAAIELPLSAPLSAWHLRYYVPATELNAGGSSTAHLVLVIELLIGTLVMAGLAFYFYREYSREVREAASRVNFVNQVSHELKTPLTNIRMYAELLESELSHEKQDGKTSRYLGVIVSESQRLSRMISNVLTFARQQRKSLMLQRQQGSVDGVIDATLEQFRPALESKGVRITHQRGAGNSVLLDSDAVGQMLGNLISNVEKYGASGGLLEIASEQADGATSITVADHGPGIPVNQRARIFQPFYRVSRNLSDGVTGTGIGLSIARELARMHGGDVVLESAAVGTRFRVTLATPPAATAQGRDA